MCSDDFCHQILLIKVLITRLGRYPLSVLLCLAPKLNNGKNSLHENRYWKKEEFWGMLTILYIRKTTTCTCMNDRVSLLNLFDSDRLHYYNRFLLIVVRSLNKETTLKKWLFQKLKKKKNIFFNESII